jgi:proline iminopeptidase
MPPTAFDQQHLPTGDGHSLYLAQFGNPRAPAAVVLHGGPGSGTQPSVLDWFDLDHQRVILFDQRGAGLSTPHGELQHNDSHQLVADIELIRTHLGIDQWMVVGGSWGATLALLYAGAHASRVNSLILRGSFLTSPREMTWFFQSLSAMVPQAWADLTQGWTDNEQQNVLATLSHKLLHGSQQSAEYAAARWSRYEDAVMQAMAGKLSSQPRDSDSSPVATRTLAKYRLQAQYLSNDCFTSETELLAIAKTLNTITCVLIHGTHDLICPPENALKLSKEMPHAQLRWIERGGHTPADPAIAKALKEAISELRLKS